MYIDISRHNLQFSAQKLGLETSFVFQQDNDPKHAANLTREWLLYYSPRQLKTPPQSPDINPIENSWHKLDVEVRKHKISCKDQLKRILLQEWHKIPNSTSKTLVFSMGNRLQAVINAKGMHTKRSPQNVLVVHRLIAIDVMPTPVLESKVRKKSLSPRQVSRGLPQTEKPVKVSMRQKSLGTSGLGHELGAGTGGRVRVMLPLN
ncbi:tc1-like transposase protein [Trichonephila clavipes]|nr:tc1-like transposase protein [Trichonephila clavipes]